MCVWMRQARKIDEAGCESKYFGEVASFFFSLGECVFRTNGALRKVKDGKESVCQCQYCSVFVVGCLCKILCPTQIWKKEDRTLTTHFFFFFWHKHTHTHYHIKYKKAEIGHRRDWGQIPSTPPLLVVHFPRAGRWTLECRNASRLVNKHHQPLNNDNQKQRDLLYDKGQVERQGAHTGGVDCLYLHYWFSTLCPLLPKVTRICSAPIESFNRSMRTKGKKAHFATFRHKKKGDKCFFPKAGKVR